MVRPGRGGNPHHSSVKHHTKKEVQERNKGEKHKKGIQERSTKSKCKEQVQRTGTKNRYKKSKKRGGSQWACLSFTLCRGLLNSSTTVRCKLIAGGPLLCRFGSFVVEQGPLSHCPSPAGWILNADDGRGFGRFGRFGWWPPPARSSVPDFISRRGPRLGATLAELPV